MTPLLNYLKQLIDLNIDRLLPSNEEYALEVTPLRTIEQLRERDKKLILEQFINPLLWQRLAEAFRQLQTGLKEMVDVARWFEVEEELKAISDKLYNLCQTTLNHQKSQYELLSLQCLLGLSNQIMELFYAYGEFLLGEKYWIAAVNHFALLCCLNGRVASYWLGLARATQSQGDFRTAIYLLKAAITLNSSNPASYMYLCQCHLQLKEVEEAESALEHLVLIADEEVWYRVVKILRLAIDSHKE